jgi:transketolase
MDIVTVLQCAIMNASDAGDPTRDRLVLSKGHAAMALYAALVETGCLDEESLASYCTDGSTLATHHFMAVSSMSICCPTANSAALALASGAGSGSRVSAST